MDEFSKKGWRQSEIRFRAIELFVALKAAYIRLDSPAHTMKVRSIEQYRESDQIGHFKKMFDLFEKIKEDLLDFFNAEGKSSVLSLF